MHVWLLVMVVWCLTASASFAQHATQEKRLDEWLELISARTGYRFLYRDALIRSITLRLHPDEEQPIEALRHAIQSYHLDVIVDEQGKIIMLVPRANQKATRIKGRVVDHKTGEPLPYAQIVWQTNEGTLSSIHGEFSLPIPQPDTITVRYLGYESLRLPLPEGTTEITARLREQPLASSAIVINQSALYTQLDEQLAGLINMKDFSPMGESNTIRALQLLPSTSLNAAMSTGLHIRGSNNDGLQVLLDGVTIFNQSHFYGMIDSFNADAIRYGGFYYDITPASFQGPPGGTLVLHTKSSSVNAVSTDIGLSNTALRATIETPVLQGQSGLLLSLRQSYMNQVNWFNNASLIGWGLDMNRERTLLRQPGNFTLAPTVLPGEGRATFTDIHSKYTHEFKDGTRWTIGLYLGNDETSQYAERFFRRTGPSQEPELRPIQTSNTWGNVAASTQLVVSPNAQHIRTTTLGFSAYGTDFSKDDFLYQRPQELNPQRVFIAPLAMNSAINEFKADHRSDVQTSFGAFSFGATLQLYESRYEERSFNRPQFLTVHRSFLPEAYTQWDYKFHSKWSVSAGQRVHYYSNGQYVRWSPRVQLQTHPSEHLSLKLGASVNHQFLHRISLANTISADVWTLSNHQDAPTRVDYFTAGMYWRVSKAQFLQVEWYSKQMSDLRLHEINISSLFSNDTFSPWLSKLNGKARGIETIYTISLGDLSLTQTYTYAISQLQSEALNNGNWFFADWDRRHQWHTTAGFSIHPNLTITLAHVLASGTPQRLDAFPNGSSERLPDYRRVDASLRYKVHMGTYRFEAGAGVYNLLNRKNAWYHEYNQLLFHQQQNRAILAVPVEVYDLGFQPSFELMIRF